MAATGEKEMIEKPGGAFPAQREECCNQPSHATPDLLSILLIV